jgi:hypothetical protein
VQLYTMVLIGNIIRIHIYSDMGCITVMFLLALKDDLQLPESSSDETLACLSQIKIRLSPANYNTVQYWLVYSGSCRFLLGHCCKHFDLLYVEFKVINFGCIW